MSEENSIFTCSQCPKTFATRSNLKRHMENPNIHNLPYARSRDQKRWKGHAKKISSRAETTERMRKWRAENRDKNKRNDLRCRVYRLARQKFGEGSSIEKQQYIDDEIKKRIGRHMLLEQQSRENLGELPFYYEPLHKIELPSIHTTSPKSIIESSGYMPSPPQESISLPPMRFILSSCFPNFNMLPPLHTSVN